MTQKCIRRVLLVGGQWEIGRGRSKAGSSCTSRDEMPKECGPFVGVGPPGHNIVNRTEGHSTGGGAEDLVAISSQMLLLMSLCWAESAAAEETIKGTRYTV